MPISSETLKRYALCILGLFFSAQGVAITKLGALGVSPISSVANVMSLRLPALSLGNWLIIWNCVLILGQILILRRKFQPIQLLQIPLSFLFGYFTDFGMWAFSWACPELYPLRLVNICWHDHAGFWHFLLRHCQRRHELGRGICQGGFRHHAQGFRHTENLL
mgnify:CR=1 FL=1